MPDEMEGMRHIRGVLQSAWWVDHLLISPVQLGASLLQASLASKQAGEVLAVHDQLV